MDLEKGIVQMTTVAFLAALVVTTAFLLSPGLAAPTTPPPVTYVYHNTTIYVNTTINETHSYWHNTTVNVNTTTQKRVYINTTYVITVPVVEILNVTVNGTLLKEPHDLNISTGAVLWLQFNLTRLPSCGGGGAILSVNAPFVLISSSWAKGVETLLIGVPYQPGVYNLSVTTEPSR